MNGIKKYVLLLALVCVSGISAFSQANLTLIPVSGDGLSPDSVSIGDSLFYNFYIKNTGNDSLVTPVSIRRSVNGNVDVIDSVSFANPLLPGDSVFLPSTSAEMVLAADYNAGGVNVVLVWPSLPVQAGTSDTTTAEVYVRGETSILDGNPIFIQTFPNPARNFLSIRSDVASREVLSTELFALNGKLVRNYQGLQSRLSLNGLPEGLYFLRLNLKDGRSWRQKILINN